MKKFCSRKFLLSAGAFLASVATSIAGIATANETVTTVGVICGIVSTAIYAFCEAWVDTTRGE